jgi:HAD superfamily hydrolase (TIGR01509 family)
MDGKPQLILDIGGVLVTNVSPLFWQELSVNSEISYDELITRYKRDIRENLWSGKISEEEFWTWLCDQIPSIESDKARAMLHSNLKPLPALEHLSRWSQFADIHLFSNHRLEWIVPTIITIQDYVKSITVSSAVGCCKPHPAIYTKVASYLHTDAMILFVDDQDKNLKQASILGWKTLLADSKGEWISKVMPLLLGVKELR